MKTCLFAQMAMLTWLLVSVASTTTALSQGPDSPSRLFPIDGTPIEGVLVRADEQSATFQSSDATKEWTSQQILKIELTSKLTPSTGGLELGLVDGSRIRGVKLVGKEQGWQFGDSAGTAIEIGPGVVKSLLVRSVNNELAEAWNSALREPTQTDALILLRPGNTIDRIGGIISEVKEGKVAFDLDGQVVDVAFDKLLGMIWFRQPRDRVKPAVEIQYTDGGTLLTESFKAENAQITFRSILGADRNQPLSRIASINYSNANLRWLADIASLGATANRRLDWKGATSAVDKVLAPRFVPSHSQASQPQNGSEDLDLIFPSAGSFTFRVPEGFNKLKSRIERSGQGDVRSEVLIEVIQDDERLLSKKLEANQESFDLDLSLQSGKKVTLTVAAEGRLQIGTQVTWKQPRLMR